MGQKGSTDKKEGRKRRDESPDGGDRKKCRGCCFPLFIALLQLLLGVAVTVVAFLMLAISPSLLTRETPHWAGIIVSSELHSHACMRPAYLVCCVAITKLFDWCIVLPHHTACQSLRGEPLGYFYFFNRQHLKQSVSVTRVLFFCRPCCMSRTFPTSGRVNQPSHKHGRCKHLGGSLGMWVCFYAV